MILYTRLFVVIMAWYQKSICSNKPIAQNPIVSYARTYGAKIWERRRINLHVQNKSYVISEKI